MKRTIPILIASFVGFLLIFSKFIPPFEEWETKVSVWFDILAAFAFVLGGGNLLKNQIKKVHEQKPGWGFAAVTGIAFLATLVVGLFKVGVPPAFQTPEHVWSGEYMQEGSAFWWTYEYLYIPLAATMFATLAFYISSAAFRAFRAKNAEASLLLGTALIVLLGQTTFGSRLTEGLPESLSMLRIDSLKEMFLNVFNTFASRAIMIGIALGIVSTSLKVLLGVDQSYLGAD